MISNIIPSAVGNALKIFLAPEVGALKWVLLRNLTGTFPSYNDVNSSVIFSGTDEVCLIDGEDLVNGTTYYYCEFDFDGSTWTPSAVVSAVPASTYIDQSVDVLSLVRCRIDFGIQQEVLLGNLSPKSGVIEVLNAAPVFDETNWPVVSVHVDADASGERSIGEQVFGDDFDPIAGIWSESQGWLAQVRLNIIGWSKNPDERIALRKAIRKIILGNLDIFSGYGLIQIATSQSDIDELSAYPAPVYESACSFSCMAPAGVADTVDAITDATVIATTNF